MPCAHLGKAHMSLAVAFSRVWLSQDLFLNLHSRLKKFLLRMRLVWSVRSYSPVRFWWVWRAALDIDISLVALESSLSHQGFAFDEGLLRGAASASAFWIVSERVVAYWSSWLLEGDSLVSSGASMWSAFISSCSKSLPHSSGSTFWMLNLGGSRFGIS